MSSENTVTAVVDLHVHSTRSDGTYSPEELVNYAREKGLFAFALTDHDTVAGIDEALEQADLLKTQGIVPPRIIPGIELSTEYMGRDVHIVGLAIHHKDPAFVKKLQEFVDSREIRNRKMCALLNRAGVAISYEELLAAYPDSVITRAHFADFLWKHRYVKSLSEAFDRYVGDHAPCFVPRQKVTPVQAIELIRNAGGIPVLAHPVLYRMSDSALETLTAECAAAGLTGLEVLYSSYSASETRQMAALAARHGLLPSGGSDFHGANKPGLDLGCGYGKLAVPLQILEDLLASCDLRNRIDKLHEHRI